MNRPPSPHPNKLLTLLDEKIKKKFELEKVKEIKETENK